MAARVSWTNSEALCARGPAARPSGALTGQRPSLRPRHIVPSAERQPPERSLQQVVQDANEVYAASKRPWCQPWTILASGSAIIGASWTLFGHGLWSLIAVGATGAITLWWYLFLVEYPVLVREQPGLQYGVEPDQVLGGPAPGRDEQQW